MSILYLIISFTFQNWNFDKIFINDIFYTEKK
jgi:hypothetical protein